MDSSYIQAIFLGSCGGSASGIHEPAATTEDAAVVGRHDDGLRPAGRVFTRSATK